MEMKYFAIGCIWLGVGLCSKSNYVGLVAFFGMFSTMAVTMS